jgi:hypothetical protein
MRKSLATLIAVGLVLASLAAPALAGKKKISDSFSAQLFPFPKLAAWGDPAGLTQPGCLSGQKDVHYMTVDFTAPAAGTLTASMAGFTGDWDLYLTDADGIPLIRSENDQIQGSAAPEEDVYMDLKPKQTVGISPCNWLGAPDAEVTYTFVYKK